MSKRLADLDAEFCRANPTRDSFATGVSFSEANGLLFLCPCGRGESLIVWFKNPPAGVVAGPQHKPAARWAATGTGLHDLSLSPSVNVDPDGDNCWHGWVKNGAATP